MKIDFIDDNTFKVYLNPTYMEINKDNIEASIKNILIKIRKKYAYEIFGFYDVDIYSYGNITNIIIFRKKDDDEYFRKNIDLKIIYHDKKDIIVNDYLLFKDLDYSIKKNKIIIDSSKLNQSNIYKICEHYSIYNKP